MKYQVEVAIEEKYNLVASLFVDRDKMHLWEQGLSRIEDTKNKLFEAGSQGYLVFVFGPNEMKMKVTVEKSSLPSEITVIYELSGAWNRCVNHFIGHDGQTKWVMESEFIFDQPNDIPLSAFIEKTTIGMQAFKQFIEGIKK